VGGAARPWRCLTSDKRRFVIKGQNNAQELAKPPYKAGTTELICGRLGRLFKPEVCPESVVVNVPSNCFVDVDEIPDGWVSPTVGPAFASEYTEHTDIRKRPPVPKGITLDPKRAARIVVFRYWLAGRDSAVLFRASDGQPISIDHGWYLTGSNWDQLGQERSRVVAPILGLFPVDLTRTNDTSAFEAALRDLESISEEDVIAICRNVPPQWVGEVAMTNGFLDRVGDIILERRDHVRGSIEREVKRKRQRRKG
jgi:hypothetical protein